MSGGSRSRPALPEKHGRVRHSVHCLRRRSTRRHAKCARRPPSRPNHHRCLQCAAFWGLTCRGVRPRATPDSRATRVSAHARWCHCGSATVSSSGHSTLKASTRLLLGTRPLARRLSPSARERIRRERDNASPAIWSVPCDFERRYSFRRGRKRCRSLARDGRPMLARGKLANWAGPCGRNPWQSKSFGQSAPPCQVGVAVGRVAESPWPSCVPIK